VKSSRVKRLYLAKLLKLTNPLSKKEIFLTPYATRSLAKLQPNVPVPKIRILY